MPSTTLRILALSLVVMPTLFACTAAAPPAPTCDDRAKNGTECPGVHQQSVAMSMCTTTVAVGNADALPGALAAATPGTCIQLGSGTFPAFDVPAGVHVIGKGEGATSLGGITAHGGGTVLAAFGATGPITASGGTGGIIVQQVRSSGAASGIVAVDMGLTILDTTVDHAAAYGVSAYCSTDPCATALPKFELRRSLLDSNTTIGLYLHGVQATIEYVEIRGTKAGNFQYGRGIDLAKGASLDAKHLSIIDSIEAAILVDHATINLDEVTLARNGRGLYIQSVDTGSKLTNFTLKDNGVVSLSVDGSKGIIVQGGEVSGTKAARVPAEYGGIADVGDGMNWRGNSEIKVSATKFSNSGRQAIIVQGKNAGELDVKLEGSDATTGIIVQGLDAGGDSGIIVQGLTPKVASKGTELPLVTPLAMATKK